MDNPSGLTDEQAMERIPVVICGIPTTVSRVYYEWTLATIRSESKEYRIIADYHYEHKFARDVAINRVNALRDQMRRLNGLPV